LVPMLVSIFTYQGFAPEHVVHLALGTALACMIVTASASLRAHALKGTVHWPLAFGLAPGIILGAYLMARSSVTINPRAIALFFAIFMALIAVQMLLKWQPKSAPGSIKPHQLIFTGLGIGAISALATVGGGFLTLSYLSYKNIDIKKAIGTSAAIGLPIAVAGTLGYISSGSSQAFNSPYTLGFVHWPALCVLALSSMLAAPLGVRCASYLAPIYLKRIFALVSLALSVKMLVAVF
ncbi:MAG TPA: sulfite exporter TauE/SafE family protein, partial [Cellvibrionaceae bacterium]|nr:sulfite exporter TauE/SafE family protein [Cellvibrionaceae bacterium]